MPSPKESWWRQASFYQIYPRSFFDANHDGEGDLLGIIDHVDYIKNLGVEAVWLSPFYPSPLADGGYDVSDPRQVDPRFGTLADFDEMLAQLHAAEIKVVVDVVPNHVSVEHHWFQEALSAPRDSEARNRFHFRPGKGEKGELPPNNWLSVFGGPAWTAVGDGTWYLHLFDSSQPDLNWTNPEVVQDGEETLRFWLDRGVDGFRIDVAFGLMKDMGFNDHHDPRGLIDAMRLDLVDPERDPNLPNPREVMVGGPFFDRDEVHEIYRGWRKILDGYQPERMSVAEAWAYPVERAMAYARADELHQVFNFDFMVVAYRPDAIRTCIDEVLETVGLVGAPATWVLSNHDSQRVVTRLGGLNKALAMAAIAHALPGGVYVYQGEELGLADAEISDDARQDPIWFRTQGREVGRDGARVPLPWCPHLPHYGFSQAQRLWLPQPSDWQSLCVESQEQNERSTLNLYQKMLSLRRELRTNEFSWITGEDTACVAFARGAGWKVFANVSDEPIVIASDVESVRFVVGKYDATRKQLEGHSVIWAS
jgi:alpha-glucosidase